jgi:hypothetical protein
MNDMIDTHDVGRRDGNGDWNGHMHRYLVLFYTDLVLVYLSRCLVWSSGFTSTSHIPSTQPTATHRHTHATSSREVCPWHLFFASLPWLPEAGGISHRLQGPSLSLLSGTGNWRTARFAEFEYRKSNSPQVLRSLRVYSPQTDGVLNT